MPQYCRACGYKTYLGKRKECGFPKCERYSRDAEIHMRMRHLPELEAAIVHYVQYQQWLEWMKQHASLLDTIFAFGTPMRGRNCVVFD